MNQVSNVSECESKNIYGSFFLGQSEFALAVTVVQEIVNAPPSYTSVPLCPPYLKGLFNLRGSIIPVLDLRTLLKLDTDPGAELQKIAIIELNGACVGFLFDRTGEVFREADQERSDFNTGSTRGIVSGVFKKDDGKRIIQILDAKSIFNLQNIPKDSAQNRLGRHQALNRRGQRKQCISFEVGPARCALSIAGIQEIIKVEKVSVSALGVGACIGAIDLRGTTVPVIDFAALLKYREVDRSETATQGDSRIVVMRLGQELFGLLVSSVNSIVTYFPDDLIAFPLVEQSRGEMFLGCLISAGSPDILLLDHAKILNDAEIAEITHGHSSLYNSRTSVEATAAKSAGARRTYITFRVDGAYAISIHEVKEIIDIPTTMLQPPGLSKHVRGVLNLRGRLVTIVDARSLYAKDDSEDKKPVSGKVLIFDSEGCHFGLVVDSVESIVTFNDQEKIKLPGLLYGHPGSPMSADISEAVEVKDTTGVSKSMLIMNLASIVKRVSTSILLSQVSA